MISVGSALRNNPFAPFVPCHRIIAMTGYIGGFSGEWTSQKTAASKRTSGGARSSNLAVEQGPKVSHKLELLRSEGVKFDEKGMLKDKSCWWKGV